MSTWRSTRMTRTVVALFALGLGLLPSVAGVALADPWGREPRAVDAWVATTTPAVSLRALPDVNAQRLAMVREGTRLHVLAEQGAWKQVHDPRADLTAYVRGDLLAESEAPSPFAYMPPPPDDDELSTVAVATADLPLYWYPIEDPQAQLTQVNASARETIAGTVTGDDGSTWFRTVDGYFLPGNDVFVASAPRDYPGRWLEVSVNGAARVIAYENGAPVRSFYAIKGTSRFPTPLGVWSIVRRVANETMDSTTVGIPRSAPGGYFLKNVLYTQYFRDTGESLHYNWWSSAWGAPGSHGCLGLSLADAKWLWDWASVGTPVLIHP
jgi:L,D-transpeptidase catalytic domain